MRRKSYNDYDQLTHEEFVRQVRGILLECSKSTLVSLLFTHAWEEVSEEFNDEALERWANAYDAAHGAPLDESEDDE